MDIIFRSLDYHYKKPFGCVRTDEKIQMHISIKTNRKIKQVYVCLAEEHTGVQAIPFSFWHAKGNFFIYRTNFRLSHNGIYFYWFHIVTDQEELDVFRDGLESVSYTNGEKWQITCFDADYHTPSSFQGKIMYQIFPDRFYREKVIQTNEKLQPYIVHENVKDIPCYRPNEHGEVLNNDFFGGNLLGIIKKIPYLDSIGVEVLYLNPIFMAFSNHRYDTADYKKIDPMLGDQEDFKDLCECAHRYGMKVILDGVFSHTGSNSVYFDEKDIFQKGAYHHEDSPYRDWYQFHHYPDDYVCWWGIKTLPCVKELQPDYLDFIIENKHSVIADWLQLGADGFRLDVADELPDEFIQKLKKRMKAIKPDSLLIGEVWEDASHKISYGVLRSYFSQTELDSVMNYPFRNGIIDFVKRHSTSAIFCETIMSLLENYPKPVIDCNMNSLSTHDTARILTLMGYQNSPMSREEKAICYLGSEERKKAIVLEEMAVFLQFVLPGCPCIYYGDEIGMEGFEDPFNRRYFLWEEVTKDNELFSFYKDMAYIRRQYSSLQIGKTVLKSRREDVLFLVRFSSENRLCAVLYNGEDSYSFCLPPHKIVYQKRCNIAEKTCEIMPYGFVLYQS